MDHPFHKFACVSLADSWRWSPCHTVHIDMKSPLYESLYVSGDAFLVTLSTGIWIGHNSTDQVFPEDLDLATQITVSLVFQTIHCYVSLYVVPWDEILATQSTGITIVPSMTLHVSLYIFPGDETFTTHSTVIWFFLIMTLHVVLHVVAEFETTVAQSNLHCMAFHVYCLVIPEAPSDYFIHQESFLPPK